MLGIKCENFVNFLSIVPFSQENSKALNTMPFISDGNANRRPRRSIENHIWLAANHKCLVLNKDKSVSFDGDGREDGTLR